MVIYKQPKPGDIVRHKRDGALVKGKVLEISKSGLRARVEWRPEHNPRLRYWGPLWAYYRLDLLEVIEGAGAEKGAEG